MKIRELHTSGGFETFRLSSRVVDPYSFFTDPDPDQSLMLEANTDPDPNPDPDPDPIRIQGFNNKKLKKNYS